MNMPTSREHREVAIRHTATADDVHVMLVRLREAGYDGDFRTLEVDAHIDVSPEGDVLGITATWVDHTPD